MSVRGRIAPVILAFALGLPMAFGWPVLTGTAQPVAAACSYTWTGWETASKSGTVESFSFTSTVKYKLEMNTCNLGVYTRIYVDKYIDKFTITGDWMNYTYATDNSAVLKNCGNASAKLCWGYPTGQVTVYVDNRVFKHTGNGTITRTSYPRVYYPYSKYTAVGDRLIYIDGGVILRFIYQFIGNSIYYF